MRNLPPAFVAAITVDIIDAAILTEGVEYQIIKKTPVKFRGWTFIHISHHSPVKGHIIGAAKLIDCTPHPTIPGYIYTFKDGISYPTQKLPTCPGGSAIWRVRNDSQFTAFNKAAQLLRNYIEESLDPKVHQQAA